MSDPYKVTLQRTACQVLEARREYESAMAECDRAQSRYDEAGKRLRALEEQLCRSVGKNITKRMWIVQDGVSVVARYNGGSSTVEVLTAEPAE